VGIARGLGQLAALSSKDVFRAGRLVLPMNLESYDANLNRIISPKRINSPGLQDLFHNNDVISRRITDHRGHAASQQLHVRVLSHSRN